MSPVKLKRLIFNLLLVVATFLMFSYIYTNHFSNRFNSLIQTSGSGILLSELSTGVVENNIDTKSTLAGNLSVLTLNGSTGVKTTNPRTLAMRKFLQDYNSPMVPYSNVFVEEAERYGLDWRLVASISGVESAFGNLIPNGTNNGWGWRGGPGGAYSIFPTWKEGIQTVTRGLALGYGITLTPFQIERAYCPPCYANPFHSWANGVTKFMNELDYYYVNLDKL